MMPCTAGNAAAARSVSPGAVVSRLQPLAVPFKSFVGHLTVSKLGKSAGQIAKSSGAVLGRVYPVSWQPNAFVWYSLEADFLMLHRI